MVFIKEPHVLIQPKWDLIIRDQVITEEARKKEEKNNDFPHPVQINQPAICFRELCNPLWLQNSFREPVEKFSTQLTLKETADQKTSISRCWNFPDKTFWWTTVTRRAKKAKVFFSKLPVSYFSQPCANASLTQKKNCLFAAHGCRRLRWWLLNSRHLGQNILVLEACGEGGSHSMVDRKHRERERYGKGSGTRYSQGLIHSDLLPPVR